MKLQGRKKNFLKTLSFVVLNTMLCVALNVAYTTYVYANDNQDNTLEANDSQEQESIANNNTQNLKSDKEKLKNVKKIAKENSQKKNIKKENDVQDPVDKYAFKMLKALGVIIGALLIILALVKKAYKGKNSFSYNGKINLLECKNLDAKSKVYLIEVEGQKVLVGLTNDSISMQNLNNQNHFEELINDELENNA